MSMELLVPRVCLVYCGKTVAVGIYQFRPTAELKPEKRAI